MPLYLSPMANGNGSSNGNSNRNRNRLSRLNQTQETKPPRNNQHQHQHDFMMSKSLGDLPASFLEEAATEADTRANNSESTIAYSGYLLKRSNHSYPTDYLSQPYQLHIPLPIPAVASAPQHLLPIPIPSKTRIQHSANLMASFFGMSPDIEQMLIIGQQRPKPTPTTTTTANDIITNKITTPIVLITTSTNQRNDTQKSAPISFLKTSTIQQQQQPPPPPANIHHKDGHLWCAKYCVLQDGVLYFYQNAADGLSTEAALERTTAKSSSCSEEMAPQDLSKSPLPRGYRKNITTPTTTTTTITNNAMMKDNEVMWEKRVALDRVGVVRSAEVEYGPYSFELLAIPEDGTNDKLVLRASNGDQMNEWLFQFHTALGSIMRNIVEAIRPTALDLARRHNDPNSFIARMIAAKSSTHNYRKQSSSNLSESLSHGHGRSGMRRRRINHVEGSPATTTITDNDNNTSIGQIISSSEHALTQSPESSGSAEIFFAFETIPFIPKITPPQEEQVSSPNSSQLKQTLANFRFAKEASGATNPKTEKPLPVTPKQNGAYVPPHLRTKTLEKKANSKPNVATTTRYVPPSIRKAMEQEQLLHCTTFKELTSRTAPVFVTPPAKNDVQFDMDDSVLEMLPAVVLGGCADPAAVLGSVMDSMYTQRQDFKVGKKEAKAVGCFGGGGHVGEDHALQWEIGAISECGIRESQEDSFLICNDLAHAFLDLPESLGKDIPMWSHSEHKPGIFAIFDGHCGNQASRYAAEKLTFYLCEKSKLQCGQSPCNATDVAEVLKRAIRRLDDDFCRVCVEDKRNWESGTTALIVAIVYGHLVIANIGDCRAVMSRSVEMYRLDDKLEHQLNLDGWTQDEDDLSSKWEHALGGNDERSKASNRWCFWKEVADVHVPSRDDERKRIEDANGWITTEKEVPTGQLQRMDLFDEDVVEILRRCFADRIQESQSTGSRKACKAAPPEILQISRVCGELAVSRAIGDRDFKAMFNQHDSSSAGSEWWECPLPLPYSDEHSRKFKGDLVTSTPEIQTVKLSQTDVVDEFLLLACDGLWDVMDPDDAIRVIRGLLFEKKWPAKKAAARLAEIAIHLGSSDNITVIVIRFFTGVEDN